MSTLVFLIASASLLPPSSGQQAPQPPESSHRLPLTEDKTEAATKAATENSVEAAIEKVRANWERSLVKLHRPQLPATLGTLVAADGLVLAKFSELAQPLECETADGQRLAGKLLAADRGLDLALIKIEASGLEPVRFSSDAEPALGDLLISVRPAAGSGKLGMISSSLNSLPLEQPAGPAQINLGITVGNQVESRTVVADGKYLQRLGLRVQQAEPRSTGEAANLLADDLICAINGQATSSLAQWQAAVQQVKVGQPIEFEVIRQNKWFKTQAITKSDQQRTIHDQWGGGPFNLRRFQFGPVIIHDTTIQPQDCGGPVFNVQGEFLGINIARSLRVATFSIPADRVKEWIIKVQPNAALVTQSRN